MEETPENDSKRAHQPDGPGRRTVRLQKFLAERGVTSRRGAIAVLEAGRVLVNGTTVREPGFRVDPEKDVVSLDGGALSLASPRARTLALYKVRGYVCSRSARQGKTVYDLLGDIPERVVPVGRLDKDSEGLLLLSNDGELVNRLTHPKFGQRKTYEVTVAGTVSPDALALLRSRLIIDEYRIQPAHVTVIRPAAAGATQLRFVLSEGRNRQIRKMCAAAGLRVRRLVRVAIGALSLDSMKPGEWRDLSEDEIAALVRQNK